MREEFIASIIISLLFIIIATGVAILAISLLTTFLAITIMEATGLIALVIVIAAYLRFV